MLKCNLRREIKSLCSWRPRFPFPASLNIPREYSASQTHIKTPSGMRSDSERTQLEPWKLQPSSSASCSYGSQGRGTRVALHICEVSKFMGSHDLSPLVSKHVIKANYNKITLALLGRQCVVFIVLVTSLSFFFLFLPISDVIGEAVTIQSPASLSFSPGETATLT